MLKKIVILVLACSLVNLIAEEINLNLDTLHKEKVSVNYSVSMDENSSMIVKANSSPEEKYSYIDCSLFLDTPIDLTDKALKITIKSEDYKNFDRFYVKAYGQSDQKLPVLSFYNWSSVLTDKDQSILIVPGTNNIMRMGKTTLSTLGLTHINRIRLSVGTKKANVPISFVVKSIEVVKCPIQRMGGMTLKGGLFFIKEDDGNLAMELSGRTKNIKEETKYQYVYGSIIFDTPIDLTNKALRIFVKTDNADNCERVYLKGYSIENDKQPVISFFNWDYIVNNDFETIIFEPNKTGQFRWDSKTVVDGDLSKVKRLMFSVGTKNKEADINLLIQSLEIVDL